MHVLSFFVTKIKGRLCSLCSVCY